MSKVCPDPLAVATVLKQIFSPGDVFEIRALEASVQGNRRPHTEIGYFDYDHIDCVGQELNRFLFAKGIYYTPNPVMPELLARAANRMKDAGRDPSTKDTEILSRRWLLIDCDPVRPSGISSTDAEHELAHAMAKKIRNGLTSVNWPQPLYCDSGNGAQLMYRIDLPINDHELVKRVLASLAMLNNGKVEVDQSVCNPSRLWRLPGTLNCRGDHTADRPHRLATVIDMPETLDIVTKEQLEQVAANAMKKAKPTVNLSAIAGPAPVRTSTFNIDDWIIKYCPDILGPSDWQGGRKWIFPVCPFNESHTNKSAVLIEQASGAIAFKCHHNGCRDYGWKELRELKEPPKPIITIPKKPVLILPSEIDNQNNTEPESDQKDPGPVPEKLLHIPGFVSRVMDFTLETAPYPNLVMAFCGAISLQAFLAGRKVRDPGDNRTNLYLLGLAHSAAGKDWPRKVNTRIIHEAGLADCLGDRFASGEGIEDALFLTPCMLFQTDEIDTMLQMIKQDKEARYENIMGTLLTLYSASNSVLPMRRKAGKDAASAIDQPCLTIFGTAIPRHYYGALSTRMLSNGFFARMMILESGKRPQGQEPSIREIPVAILETAKWWRDFRPGKPGGNLFDWHPVPAIVDHTGDARNILVNLRKEVDHEYGITEDLDDETAATVWGRVNEHVRKLALIYAVSEDHVNPLIGKNAAVWASQLVIHQTRRMLFMAQTHVSTNDFEAKCKELVRVLTDAHKTKRFQEWVPFWHINRRLPWNTKDHKDVRESLQDQMRIECELTGVSSRGGRPGWRYRLMP